MMGAGCRWITDTAGIGHCRDSGMQMMATACGPSSSRSGSSPGNVSPDTVLVLGISLSGAVSSSAYLFFPWADQLGGAG